MRFYTDLDKFNLNDFKNLQIYNFNHMLFYFCLLPYDLKKELIQTINPFHKDILEDIFKIHNEFVDIESCDYVVIPYLHIKYSPYKFFQKYSDDIEFAFKHNKKVLFFYGGDNNIKFNVPEKRGYVFRNSGFLSEKFDNVFSIPTFSKDCFDGTYLNKKLSVSFCGYPESSSEGIAIDSKYCGIRKELIHQLSEKDYCNFILRTSWCNILEVLKETRKNEKPQHTLESTVEDFIENLKNSLYCLCVRGGGNFSFRLGETFMMGRIPVLIDTDCILPFYDIIDYRKNTIYVDQHNSKNFTDVSSVIEKFHESHSEEELISIQKENRKIWETYFKPHKTFNYICNLLKN